MNINMSSNNIRNTNNLLSHHRFNGYLKKNKNNESSNDMSNSSFQYHSRGN